MRHAVVRFAALPGLMLGLALPLVAIPTADAAPARPSRGEVGQPDEATAARAGDPAHGRARAVRAADRLIAQSSAELKAGPRDHFHRDTVTSSSGVEYVRYQRTYRGLPVVGGDIVISTDSSGRVLTTSVGQRHRTRLPAIAPVVTRGAARARSARLVHHAHLGATRLVVLQRQHSQLAWETTVSGRRDGGPSKLTVYVDARRLRVLDSVEQVLEGTGNTKWEGTVTIPTTQSGSTYSMTNSNAPTLTCQDAATNRTLTKTSDTWGNGNETSKETDCADALYATEMERQMLAAWDGRNGMDGHGGWVPIRVGLNDVNAYYDGSQVQVGHTQSTGEWIAATDVIAHEMGHGIDQLTGGISRGATQEFVADTFGAATEWYANNPTDRPDFTVGEQVNLVGQGPIRYMYKPSLAGDPDCYSSAIPAAEVHAAAGPGNHWFYLLAEGTNPTDGQPASPTCNGTTLKGLGIKTAQQIMYHAMLLKSGFASYEMYRRWTLSAARDLFTGCQQYDAVKAAWDAVKVPPPSTGDPTCARLDGSWDGSSGYTLDIQLPALLARTARGPGAMTTTRTATAADATIPATSTADADTGREVFYELDNTNKVSDVVVTGRARSDDGRLAPLQWDVSSGGVELFWRKLSSGGTWDIWRNGTKIGSSSSGSFQDPSPPTSATRYEVRIQAGIGGAKPIDFVLIVPPLNRSVIGTTMAAGGAATDPLVAPRAGSEVGRILEWNAFIPNDVIPTYGCNLPGSGINYFAGDNRDFATTPAADAFDSYGKPRSRISVRVGSSFAVSGTSDPNQTTWNNWFLNQVGTSGGYDGSKRLVAMANAGTAEVTMPTSHSSSTQAFRDVHVDSSNPLCYILGVFDAPAISQHFTYVARADGSMLVIADFDQAPSTEMLWQSSTTPSNAASWQGGCLFRFSNRGFAYLGSPAQAGVSVEAVDPTVSTSCPVF